MGTVVCQGLQSCLESQLVESRALRLRLSSTKPHFSQSLELALNPPCLSDSNTNEPRDQCHYEQVSHKAQFLHQTYASPNPDSGGWSFLQALSNTSRGLKESTEKESIYVHPLVKRSSSRLSDKSLELCTENLGSETGTDIIENSVFSLSPSDSKVENSSPGELQSKPCKLLQGANKRGKSRSFPPPLTTMSSGSESLRVRPHREDGRLIIKAVRAPSVHTYFRAERSHGRLRLSLVKDSAPNNFDSIDVACNEENEAKDQKVEMENDMNHEELLKEEEEEEEEEEKEEKEGNSEEQKMETEAARCEEEVINNINGNELEDVGADELGQEGFQRPRRCKQGDVVDVEKTAMLLRWEWEPFWAAISKSFLLDLSL